MDKFLISYFLGTTALGYYTIAYHLIEIMVEILSSITNQVAFATFSRLQKDLKRLRGTFYQATQATSLVAVPAFLGVAILAPEIVTVLYGTKWVSSIPVLRVLAFAGILQATFQFNGNVVISLGKPGWMLGQKILSVIAKTIAFLLVMQWGLVAVAAADVVLRYAFAPLFLWFSYRLLHFNIGKYFAQYLPSLLGSLAMLAAVSISKHILEFPVPHLGLFTSAAIGLVMYVLVIWSIKPEVARQVFDLVCSTWKHRMQTGVIKDRTT
jgi:PST family polysaccharide transporter